MKMGHGVHARVNQVVLRLNNLDAREKEKKKKKERKKENNKREREKERRHKGEEGNVFVLLLPLREFRRTGTALLRCLSEFARKIYCEFKSASSLTFLQYGCSLNSLCGAWVRLSLVSSLEKHRGLVGKEWLKKLGEGEDDVPGQEVRNVGFSVFLDSPDLHISRVSFVLTTAGVQNGEEPRLCLTFSPTRSLIGY
ncbi:hypothetical protein ANTQUA_LOCUS2706 [Anthophora quadrimaculata]